MIADWEVWVGRGPEFCSVHPFAFIACARGLLFYLPGSLHYYGHE